jgi:hypothetical protein
MELRLIMKLWNEGVSLPFNPLRVNPLRVVWALAFGTLSSVFLFPLLGWQGIILGTVLGPLTFVSVLTDSEPIKPQIQRALWATALTTAMFLTFTVFWGTGDKSSSTQITIALLLQPLLVDGAIQTWIQLIERAVEPSISRFMVRFKLIEPLANLSWYGIVISHYLANIPLCLVKSAAQKKLIIPQPLGWKRPHFSLVGENSLNEYRQAVKIGTEVKTELASLNEEKRTRLEKLQLWGTLIPIMVRRIILDDYFKPTQGLFLNWENVGRLILVPIQALIRLGGVISGILTRSAVETGICVGLYSLWYLDAHPNGNLDLAVKIGLWQVIVQAFHYSKWQFVNRSLEPVLINASAGTMVKFRVAFGKAFVQFIRLFADVAISTTEYLTEDEPAQKQTLLLPPSKPTPGEATTQTSEEPATVIDQPSAEPENAEADSPDTETIEVKATEVPASEEDSSNAPDKQE